MNEEENIPLSKNVGMKEAQGYWITAGSWRGIYGVSYEIGIRQKEGAQEFWLLQGNWPERTILKVAEAVRVLLDAGFSPTEVVREIFNEF